MVIKLPFTKTTTVIINQSFNQSFAYENGDGYINIREYQQSKLWFYRAYTTRIFFCYDIGIMAFIAIMSDTLDDSMQHTSLLWTITNVDIAHELSTVLFDLKTRMPTLRISIFLDHSVAIPYEIIVRFNYLQRIIFDNSKIDIVSGMTSPAQCNIRSVNIQSVLSQALIYAKSHNIEYDPVGVFACGPNAKITNLKREVDISNGNKHGVLFRMYAEIL